MNPESAQNQELEKLNRIYPRYGTELVASVTAQIVCAKPSVIGTPNSRESYRQAAREAIMVLDAVGVAMEERERRIEEIAKMIKRPEERAFNEGIKIITGYDRVEHAESAFQDLRADMIKQSKKGGRATPSEISAVIEHYRDHGFSPYQLELNRKAFLEWKATNDKRKSPAAEEKRKKALEEKEGKDAKRSLGVKAKRESVAS